MVVFTCNACGESLKKAQVEKHVMKCRSCQVLSCIDCSKDFWGDDYRNHIKCISEDQKYGSKDFQVKVNKGDVKQQQWIQRIQQAMEQPHIEPSLRSVLQKVSAYDNVPRKRAKFENWMKNCLKICSPCLLEKVWEICSTAAHSTASERENRSDTNDGAETNKNKRDERKDKKSKRKTSDENTEQNGENTEKQRRRKRRREENEQNTDEKSNKKQKRREQEAYDESPSLEGEEPASQESESSSAGSSGKFNWKGTIKAVLRDAPEDGLAVKKLRKKVLAAYYSFTGDSNYRSEEELLSLFNRKINNNPKFKILKDRVRLQN
uniref:Cell growth-regulating nucleolar protein n=1 Tax=Cyprinus carpio carpio TaxID=630221 RepID=A0A9J8DAS2_CYPCA